MPIVFVWVGGCVLAFATVVTWMVRRAWRRAWDDLGARATALGPGAGTGPYGGSSAHPSWWETGTGGGSSSGCSGGGSPSCGSGSPSCGGGSPSCGGSSSSCGGGSSSRGGGSSSCGSSSC
jgi:hypothetical protein